MRTRRAALCIAVSLLLLSGCAHSVESATSPQLPTPDVTQASAQGEYILPGNPRGLPLEDLSKVPQSVPDSERLIFKDLPRRAEYDMLVRESQGELMVPSDVIRQPTYVSGLGEILGFTLYYPDSIVLIVTPVETTSDVLEKLDSTMATNTAGVARTYEKGTVRGQVAAVRAAGRQKWSSGVENPYPALVTWDETSPQGIRLRYALFGYAETTTGLADLAGEMDLLPMIAGDKTFGTAQQSGKPLREQP